MPGVREFVDHRSSDIRPLGSRAEPTPIPGDLGGGFGLRDDGRARGLRRRRRGHDLSQRDNLSDDLHRASRRVARDWRGRDTRRPDRPPTCPRSRTERPGSSTFRAAFCSRGSSTRIITPSYPRWSCELTTNIGFEAYRTRGEALDALKALAAKTPPGQWITASFYDNLLQGGDLSMTDLDAVSTQHPIFVIYVNGHEGAGNGLAFQLAKVPEDVGELPGGGHFGRGPDGKLNGLVYEPPALLRFMAVALPPDHAGADDEIARVLCEGGGCRRQYDAARARHRSSPNGFRCSPNCQTRWRCE